MPYFILHGPRPPLDSTFSVDLSSIVLDARGKTVLSAIYTSFSDPVIPHVFTCRPAARTQVNSGLLLQNYSASGKSWRNIQVIWDSATALCHRWKLLCKKVALEMLENFTRAMEHRRSDLLRIAWN
ncbi:hypothetical protein BRADI_1g03633v3 [Brachypodium distachyon]|uniref:Uncharacterized protein n=1 Tax=Brachypodium distachyon TaxID=15368 RepID=A0A2K2DHZ2_BRADI|nr:hypothetical protein BRADI_1g03633v3 [Brachypodium distachyon]